MTIARNSGTCDPTSRGQATNRTTLQSGLAFVDIIWGWDGISVQPECEGPLISVHAVNADSVSHWVHFEGRRGQSKTLELTPGLDRTFTAAQMRQRGFDSFQDTVGITLTDSP